MWFEADWAGSSHELAKRLSVPKSAYAKRLRKALVARGGHQNAARPIPQSEHANGFVSCQVPCPQYRCLWNPSEVTYSALDLDKGEGDGGLPLLRRAQHEVVERIANAVVLPVVSVREICKQSEEHNVSFEVDVGSRGRGVS